jgi:multidrug transporter EmrE-like cation transporter
MIITLLQALVFISYIGYITYRFGVLPSISESWYKLEPLRTSFLFTLFCWSLSTLMLFQTNETTAWFFASGAGLAFVGAATMFKWSGAYTDKIHGAGAAVGITCALVGLGVEYNNWIPTAVFVALATLFSAFKVNNKIWWTEIVAFICVISGLLYRFV